MQHFLELPAEATAWLVLLQQIMNNDNNDNKSQSRLHAVTGLQDAETVGFLSENTVLEEDTLIARLFICDLQQS